MKIRSEGGRALVMAASLVSATGVMADHSIRNMGLEVEGLRFASLADSRSATDASVTERVRSKLANNTNTRDLHIQVESRNRVVYLRGEVWSSEERDLAELLARNIESVAEVRNDLTVRGRPVAR